MNAYQWRILVVEDDPDGQDVLRRILHYHSMKLDSAFDGEQALELLVDHTYSAAVIDLALPGLDGWGLIKAIRGDLRTADLPCFACTAYHSAEVAYQAMQSGFTAYFPKPLDPSALVSEIQHVLSES